MGKIEAICISRKKGTVKKEIALACLKEDYGIVGDAHAGKWHRQISLLSMESIDRMKEKLPQLANGAFAENIITSGLQCTHIHIGDRLLLGKKIILEVSQIGKECHTACAIRQQVGDCIMPREGLFCKVIRGGGLVKGDTISLIKNPQDTSGCEYVKNSSDSNTHPGLFVDVSKGGDNIICF